MYILPNVEKKSSKEMLKDVYNDVKSIFSREYEFYIQTYPNYNEYKYVTNAIYGDDLKKIIYHLLRNWHSLINN